jgi:hypothetical protein
VNIPDLPNGNGNYAIHTSSSSGTKWASPVTGQGTDALPFQITAGTTIEIQASDLTGLTSLGNLPAPPASVVNADLVDVDFIMVRDENITPNGRDYDQIFNTLATADVDFYVDLSDIYGGQLIPNLGAGTVDNYGNGYDVMTSAQVDLFGNDPNLRVYYDGKHTDFEDTGDIINTSNPGKWTMVQGDTSNGGEWATQVKTANPQGGEGSFFIVVGSVNGVGGKKIAVKHSDGEWIADNTALSIAQSVDMGTVTETIRTNAIIDSGSSMQDFINSVAERYSIPPGADLTNYVFTYDIYLNATEQQITEILQSTDGSLTSEKAFNFGFYTKVSIDGYTVNLKINQTADPLIFDLDPTDIDLMVESFYNTVETSGSGVDSGSQAGNFVKVDDASDISMGNGGSDTYVIAGVNSGTKVVGGTVLEYGDVNQTVGGLDNSIDDSINFSGVSDIHQLKISRGEIKNEATDSSLFISDVNDTSLTKSVVFDNYNDYLDFRRVEFLTIDDASNNDEIFEISVDDNSGTDGDITTSDLVWDNEIVVADNQGDTIYADGGTDILVGGSGQDTFDLSGVLDGTTTGTNSSNVYIKNIAGTDGITMSTGDDYSANYAVDGNSTDGVIDVQTAGGGVYHIHTDDEATLKAYLDAATLV